MLRFLLVSTHFSIFISNIQFELQEVEDMVYLVPGQFVPVSLLLFDQFDDGLVGLHFPAAPVHDDVCSKVQLSSVGPTVHAAPEHNTETHRDVIKPKQDLVSVAPVHVFSVCPQSVLTWSSGKVQKTVTSLRPTVFP